MKKNDQDCVWHDPTETWVGGDPKNKPIRNYNYLRWLRKQKPLIPGYGPTECHHIRCFKHCGMGVKPPDNESVPVAWSVHRYIHDHGEKDAFKQYGYSVEDLEKICKDYWKQYLRKNIGASDYD